jgi:hypothetical protein
MKQKYFILSPPKRLQKFLHCSTNFSRETYHALSYTLPYTHIALRDTGHEYVLVKRQPYYRIWPTINKMYEKL